MKNLRELIRAVQTDLPITVRHDQWLQHHSNLDYSDKAKEFSQNVFDHTVGGSRSRGSALFRTSGMGLCQRRRMFAALGVHERDIVDSKVSNIFHTGHFLHLKWQMAGITEGWLAEAEVPVAMEAMSLAGTLDGILFDGSGFEFKSINDSGYTNVLNFGPKDLHVRQVHGYMFIRPDITKFSIVYENKNNGEWREFRVERDDALIRSIDSEIGHLLEDLRLSKMPKILNDCQTKEGATYRNCPFKDVCLGVKGWPVVANGKVQGA